MHSVNTTQAQSPSPSETTAVHVEVFTRLARDYCFEFAGRKRELIQRLMTNSFSVHPDHELTFVRKFGGVSYAITLDDHRCTVDVLLGSLSSKGVESLFDTKAIVTKLVERVNLTVAKSEIRTDQDFKGVDTRVLWIQFQAPGYYVTLSYPQDRLNSYYLMFDVVRLAQ